MKQILKIINVKKYYGTGTVITKALNDVSFSVDEGEFVAIMGASGSGKSTLLNVISTIDRPSGGSILIEGNNIEKLSENQLSYFRRDKLGFIFQDYNLLDTLTIEENIVLPLTMRKKSVSEIKKSLEDVSEILDINDQLKKFPMELSGGQRQRVACARAIIGKPSLILADEPTGALDSANSKSLMNTFVMMNKKLSATLLMVTHDAMVGSYADRVLFLKDGRIWNEIFKGSRGRTEMYKEIMTILASLGGESSAL